MHFVIYCLDDPSKPDLRAATRDAHLAYVDDVGAIIKVAGPMTNAAGTSIGSMFIIEADDQETVEALAARDPYAEAGVFSSVDIRPFKWLITDGKRA